MEQAIKKAIEGGYKIPNSWDGTLEDALARQLCLLDPSFWQCLGKAMGRTEKFVRIDQEWWHQTWHRFIDHLAEGKDTESFFKELIK